MKPALLLYTTIYTFKCVTVEHFYLKHKTRWTERSHHMIISTLRSTLTDFFKNLLLSNYFYLCPRYFVINVFWISDGILDEISDWIRSWHIVGKWNDCQTKETRQMGCLEKPSICKSLAKGSAKDASTSKRISRRIFHDYLV